MIISMTGYGKSICQLNDKTITVEIRTLNSKNMDLNLKTPNMLRERDNAIRNILNNKLERGKTEIIISLSGSEIHSNTTINKKLFAYYYNELKDLASHLQTEITDTIIPAILRLPDVLQSVEDEIAPEEWKNIEKAIMEAIEQVINYRKSEGEHLQKDIVERTIMIHDLLKKIEPFENNRIQNIRDRITRSLKDLAGKVQADENRFEQEVIFYLEKLDITEEKVRLQKHLDYFHETIESQQAGGKKLSFISQEIGREINTIGSKANDADIQRIVVQMKDELEKIKEQLMNVL